MFEALDDTIRSVLGKNISDMIYSITQKQTTSKIKGAENNINVIISYLEKLIGKEGTNVIQAISIKRLCLRLKREYEEIENHFSLLDELYETKFKLLAPLLNTKNLPPN
jgi:phosphoenolpyruvate carboxylase